MLVVLARDLVLVLGYKLVVPRGYDFEVSFLGKLATWVLYAALCFVIVTEGDDLAARALLDRSGARGCRGGGIRPARRRTLAEPH